MANSIAWLILLAFLIFVEMITVGLTTIYGLRAERSRSIYSIIVL